MIDERYGYIDKEDYDPFGEIVPIVEDTFNRIGWENLFHNLPKEQLEVLVCLYLGFKPTEIVKILHYKNIAKYYNVSAKLRRLYREQKDRFIDYNDI